MKDLLNRLRRDVPWGTLVDVISQNVEQRIDATGEIVEQLKQWGAHLTSNALSKWTRALIDPQPCQVPHVTGGSVERCHATAVVECDSCGRATCLAHCRVDFQADATCAVCIGEAKMHFRREREDWEGKKTEHRKRSIASAFRALHLKPSATFAEVKKQYKTLVRQYNADVPQTDKQRERNTRRLQKINEAFEVLKQHFEEAA